MVDAAKFLTASNAYNNTIGRADQSAGGSNAVIVDTGKAGGPNFTGLVSQAIDTVAATTSKGEVASIQEIAGKASLGDVALAVSQAEMTLKTVVAVRDKVIAAYQDIIKMPI